MSYLIDKFKGIYKIKAPIDENTNDFTRKLNGTYEDVDCYIDCYYNTRIFYYGKGILQAYIPSLGRGRNTIRQLYFKLINPKNVELITINNKTSYKIIDEGLFEKDLIDNKYIFDIEETDEEILFKFSNKYSDVIIPSLKPKTSASNRSPFSSKNLPRKTYEIPCSDLEEYKEITRPIKDSGNLLALNRMTQNFFSEMQKSKSYKGVDIKSLMKKKMLHGKEFIHAEGYWKQYLTFLEKEVKNFEI